MQHPIFTAKSVEGILRELGLPAQAPKEDVLTALLRVQEEVEVAKPFDKMTFWTSLCHLSQGIFLAYPQKFNFPSIQELNAAKW